MGTKRVLTRHKKAGEACASPAGESIGTPLMVDCRSALAFPTSPGSAFVLPFGCQLRVFLPPFFIDAGASISRDRASLSSHPLWYGRFFWQNPAGVTRPVPFGRIPFFLALLLSGGSAFGSSTFLPFPAFRPFPVFLLLWPGGQGFRLTGGLDYACFSLLSKHS